MNPSNVIFFGVPTEIFIYDYEAYFADKPHMYVVLYVLIEMEQLNELRVTYLPVGWLFNDHILYKIYIITASAILCLHLCHSCAYSK